MLAACGDGKDAMSSNQSAENVLPDPMDVIYALPPEAQPYGLDVYTANCAGCHGELGQGVDSNPALKGLSAAEMMQRLKDYREGTVQGEQAALMTQAVAKLSDADLAAVSRYAGE
ncbi:MAG TPA: c-type cytochrome [Thiobacillus sp.]|nr:c-type cytochrome [Thiobacillus sp.]